LGDQAINLIVTALEDLGPKSFAWFFGSSHLERRPAGKRIRDLTTENAWNWTVEVVFNPDEEIITWSVVISSDSHVLNETSRWVDLNRYLLDERLKKFWLIDLSG